MNKKFFGDGNTLKSCFTSFELEALFIMLELGYSERRLEDEVQEKIDKKLEEAALRVLGVKDWRGHAKYLIERHGNEHKVTL